MTDAPALATLPAIWSAPQRDAIAREFAALAVMAGAVIMRIYASAFDVRAKGDGSPVSQADEEAEAVILAGLATLMPGMPVLAEEAAARGEAPQLGDAFILVDPLDGTREFVSRNGEFTVNIALVSAGAPVAGAVYAPALETLWYGGAHAFCATVAPGADLASAAGLRPIRVRQPPAGGLTALASRSHADVQTEQFLARLPIAERIAAGSSLKFCRVAEGLADVYPRFGPTMEWDTAAGDAVLRAAGGITCGEGGAPLLYCKAAGLYRNGSFVAWGGRPVA